ncbi:scavenger receptor cysteine-rich type 1 protein M160 [Labrus mixtus]|uniref:scavenger receptor cysteine-rich type 1 protein M160 n=1 Tax=Labrus mixtus TaxID=508554 RepID=UPI0029C033BA|nr:scavenger receptor cysteine-rich type 1 protein M160 [Labrus mixtus]
MWFLLLLVLFNAHIEPLKVIAQKVILKRGNEACAGHVKIYHNEQWGYVGHTNWNESTEAVVCRSTHCGVPVIGSSHMELRPMDSKVWLDEVQCNGKENDLLSCKYPGLDLNNFRDDCIRTIKCSNEIKISLEGYKCAGAVRYSTGQGTAPGYICADNFHPAEANLLCRSLGCGESKEIPKPGWFGGEEFESSKKMRIKCYDTESLTNLWQCADRETRSCQNPASVICTDYVRVQLKGSGSNVCSGRLEKEENDKWTPVKENNTSSDVCQQMHCGTSGIIKYSNNEVNVKCSDNVSVVLLDDNKREGKCYGTVHVEVNNRRYPVCASTWTRKEAQVVCREKNCGSVLSHESKRGVGEVIMDNVKCFGSESSLWHCLGSHKNKPFRCINKAYVVCSGSMDVRLADSPGRCAGRLEIQHKGKWQRVNQKSWQDTNSDLFCNHLQCGNKRRTGIYPEDQYSQGSGDSVTVKCTQNALRISECITNEDDPVGQKKAVRITCEKHSVVFLDGKNSCSGMVGIEQGTKTFWLSGSNETWTPEVADTVCRQMHCGEALNFNSTSNADEKKEFWNETYSCSSNSTSLFECQKTAPPLTHTDIATVTCKGNKKVNLTKECWGNVNICVGGECGGVFSDTWTEKKSQMLCENLKCGNAILKAKNPLPDGKVSFKSVHATKQTSDISQCNFIKNNDNVSREKAAFVVCSGSVDARIKANRDKCCGNVEVFFEGQRLPVCKDALKDKETQNIICGEQNCGQAVEMNDFFGPKPRSPSISLIKCNSGVKSLKDCTISSDVTPCSHAGLQCSRCRKMELKTDEDCIKGKACKGAVMVYSGKDRSAVSVDSLSETEMNRLCQDLKCGNFSNKKPFKAMTESFWNTSFSCARENNPGNIWACENKTAPSQKNQLYIECQDEPVIKLSGKCGGEVTMNNINVCDTHWHDDYSDLVCQEMGCVKAVGHFSEKVPRSDEEYHHVKCEKYHSKLGQCRRFKAKCEGGLVSVYCVHKVEFRTTEKCGAQIQVKYRNEWENVCLVEPLNKQYEEKLCERLQCATHNATIPTSANKLETTLNCKTVPNDVEVCVRHSTCTGLKRATIYCEGYVEPGRTEPTRSTVPIILGVGILLVLVIVAIVFIRIYIVRKNKRAMNATSRMSKMEEVEFESGDYEDVNSKANEMEDLSRLRPEAEIITEGDAQSLPSLPYDDVDVNEALLEARPLTSQASFAVVSGDNLTFEDQVAYEVDDPQENYDDIEHSPKIAQTKAAVHDGPQTTPARAGLLKRDEDYLVPGQDG